VAKKSKLKTLKAKAWKQFSLFIRQRDADSNGFITCPTCGTYRDWREVDAGHWLSRGFLATLFEETNVYAQCKSCNGFYGGRPDDMERHVERLHGKEEVERLRALKLKPAKFSQENYIDLIETYKGKVEKL
jgi:uncharacterized C2H2 Zn-finger protein